MELATDKKACFYLTYCSQLQKLQIFCENLASLGHLNLHACQKYKLSSLECGHPFSKLIGILFRRDLWCAQKNFEVYSVKRLANEYLKCVHLETFKTESLSDCQISHSIPVFIIALLFFSFLLKSLVNQCIYEH